MSAPADRPAVGLRERQKATTSAAIRQHALRLFREHGYATTTVEQIAEAAVVSQRTLCRYFPTKEDLVVRSDVNTAVIAAFKEQQAELSPIRALRNAIHSVFASLPADQLEAERQRRALIVSTPELRARTIDHLTGDIPLLAHVIAERLGRDPDDPPVRTLAGALIGVGLSATLAAATDPTTDFLTLFDTAMAHLQAGLPL